MATKTASLNRETLLLTAPLILRNRNPLMIRGPHGIGKSEAIYEMASSMRKILELESNSQEDIQKYGEWGMPVVERRASQMPDAGDIMGLPLMDRNVTEFAPMKWFSEACQRPVVLFFDEVDRASKDVQQALMELTDSRKIAGHHLHDDTVIIACCNSGEDESQYNVGEMDPAEIDRWAIVDYSPTVEEWLRYAKQNLNPILCDFIKENQGFLENGEGSFEPNKIYPSRRSWTRLNSALEETDLFNDIRQFDPNGVVLYYLIQSYVGADAAHAFKDYIENYEKNITVEHILIDGNLEGAKKLNQSQHLAIVDKMKDHDLFKSDFTKEMVENLARYVLVVPPELALTIWSVTTSMLPKNGLLLHQAKVGNRKISSYYAEINRKLEKSE